MATAEDRFRETLQSLFRSDHSELEFGISRVFNQKRAEVKRFVDEQLADEVHEALRTSGATTVTEEERDAVTRQVYDDLARFFDRHHEDGDVITRRPAATQDSTSPICDGEEVLLHWANRDQYYVQTADHFRDYRFTVGDVTVQFRLVDVPGAPAEEPEGERSLVLADDDPVSVDAEARACDVRFAYRRITEAEGQQLLELYNAQQTKSAQRKTNDRSTLVVATTQQILNALPDDALWTRLGTRGEGDDRCPLHRHLDRYTATDTTDSFVHKDLRGFLREHLRSFVQNDVLDFEALLEGKAAHRALQLGRAEAVRTVGNRLIELLAQVEDVQKRLFEKQKFIVDTGYCVTLDHVPAALYDDILDNEAQLNEWRELYRVDEWTNAETDDFFSRTFLEEHPSVMIDTRHFGQAFEDAMLAHLSGREEALADVVDGVCLQGENFQALNLLQARYRDAVDCVYVDPPYNSHSTDILYENKYRHSTWLSMMDDRLQAGRSLLASDGIQIIAIDEHEQERLGLLVEEVFPGYDQTCVTVEHNPRGIQGKDFSYTHEYAYFLYPEEGGHIRDRRIEEADWEYSNLRNWGGESRREDGRNCFYPIVVADGEIVDLGDVPPGDWHPDQRVEALPSGAQRVWPIDRNGVERKWRYTAASLRDVLDTVRVRTINGRLEVEIARSRETPRTVWTGSRYDASTHGTRLLSSMLGAERMPDDPLFPKSIHTVEDCLDVSIDTADSGQTVFDFFAGSGTTGHALMRLDGENGGDNTYVMVERGSYFDTVLLPRLKKAAFSEQWADGVPQAQSGRSHVLKYHRLESYEDTLDNLELEGPDTEPSLIDRFDDSSLRYTLSPEACESETLLEPDAFTAPFRYTLRVQNGLESPSTHTVDLERTFNYLLGLRIAARRTYRHQGRRYVVVTGTVPQESAPADVMVVWRRTGGLDLEAEAAWAAETLPEGPFDAVYVNGPSDIHGRAEPLEGPFRERMDPAVGDVHPSPTRR